MKEYTIIVDAQLTHIDTCTKEHSLSILESVGGLEGWKRYIAEKMQKVMLEDIRLDADDVLVKDVQIFERDVKEDVE